MLFGREGQRGRRSGSILLIVFLATIGQPLAGEDCRSRLEQLQQSKRSVELLLQQLDALVGGLEEQLASVRARLEASEDPEEQARLEELAVRLGEQIGRVQDQRAQIREQVSGVEEALNALGNCGQ